MKTQPMCPRLQMSPPPPCLAVQRPIGSEGARTGQPFHASNRGKRRSGGFTLVEVLVAVLVISIGMLGVARLVLAAVKANDSAYMRTQAANLAYAILDEMRANRAYAISTSGYDADTSKTTFPATNCDGVYCTPAKIAQYDLYRWQQDLGSQYGGALPDGQGVIKVTLPTGPGQLPTVTITVTWDDSLAEWAFGTPTTTTTSPGGTFTLESAL